MITIKDLRVRYGPVAAVSGVSLAVGEGQVVAVIGANGAGKTTVLRAVMGLARGATGEVSLEDGTNLLGLRPYEIARRGIRWVPEGGEVFAELTVEENLLVGVPSGVRNATERIEEAYARFPRLAERRAQRAGTLSGGERQMLAVARAVLGEPRLLLMDEPSLGLAPALVDEVFSLIEEMNATGISILLVEQEARRALKLAHRAFVLQTGEVVMEGSGAELLDSSHVVDHYLGGV